jgi:hypothetical protein
MSQILSRSLNHVIALPITLSACPDHDQRLGEYLLHSDDGAEGISGAIEHSIGGVVGFDP